MAFSFGFYNSLNHDRLYDAKEMSRIFDGLIIDGVYATVGGRFVVRAAGADNTVIVSSGRAWFNHTWNYNDADMILEGPASHLLLKRWDAIVLDINSNNEYRTNQILWVAGTPASNPSKPAMIREADHNQYPLCYIYRRSNDNSILATDIENNVGTDLCPYTAGLLTDTKNIAPVENNTTASKAYAAGEYILWEDELYRTTRAIAQGATFIPSPNTGYNIARTTIAEELYTKFQFDTTPTQNSLRAVTSGGIYNALQTAAPALGGTKLISNGQVYTALGNRKAITTAAPAQNGTALITNGQVYTALGNRPGIVTSAPSSGSNELITSGQVYTALGDRTSIVTSAPSSGSNNLITSGQVYTALGNRTSIVTSAPASGGTNLITNGQVYIALLNKMDDDRITYGTSDLTPGTSRLYTDEIYMVYE